MDIYMLGERRTKMKRMLLVFGMSIVLCFSSIGVAFADTGTSFSKQLVDSEYPIYPATIEKMNQATSIKPGLIDFFNKSIEFLNEEVDTGADEFNSLLYDTVESTMYTAKLQEAELDAAKKAAEQNSLSGVKPLQQAIRPNSNTQSLQSAKDAAYAAYHLGIQKVREKNAHKQQNIWNMQNISF